MVVNHLANANKIAKQVEDKGYVVERLENAVGDPLYAFRGRIVVGDMTTPCDTAMSVRAGDVPGGARVEFATFIHEGRQGKNIQHAKEVITNLSYGLHGKLQPDPSDDSYDLMYITSEPASKLDANLVVENIHHHAQVKTRLKPHLDNLDDQLDLERHTKPTESEKFGQNYVSTLRGLPSTPAVSYFPDSKRSILNE